MARAWERPVRSPTLVSDEYCDNAVKFQDVAHAVRYVAILAAVLEYYRIRNRDSMRIASQLMNELNELLQNLGCSPQLRIRYVV